MRDELSDSSESESDSERQLKDFIVPGVWIGYVLSVAGVVIGIAMAVKSHPVACDAPHQCHAHPQGLLGMAIVVISVMLGILIGIAGAIAKAILSDRPSPTP